MHHLIYCSHSIDIIKWDLVKSILNSARKTNTEQGVTGVLFYNRKYFLQALEGSREALNQLYKKILLDPRHKDLVILSYERISKREFPSWSMGIANEKKVNHEVYLQFGMNKEFNPYELENDNALLFLKELQHSATILESVV